VDGQDRERLELERAGWERLEHEGEAVWRNPVSGLVGLRPPCGKVESRGKR
jgi:hypothetical protein